MFICLRVKYHLFLSDFFYEILSSLNSFSKKKLQIPSVKRIHPVEAESFLPDGRTDGRIGMAKQIVAFPKFSKAPKNTNMILTKNHALLSHYAESNGNFYRRFATTCRCHRHGPKMVITTTCCVTTQKSAFLIYSAKVCNHKVYS